MHLIKSLIALLLFSSAALASAAETQNTVNLNGDWQLSYWQQPAEAVTSPADMNKVNVKTIPAKVPGNVEIDLLAAGLIKDPMIGDNVNDLRPWEGYQWCYTKEFTAPTVGEGQTLQLFFGGIDCLADIWLNGEHIGKAENMLIEHTFDITKQVKQGGHQQAAGNLALGSA